MDTIDFAFMLRLHGDLQAEDLRVSMIFKEYDSLNFVTALVTAMNQNEQVKEAVFRAVQLYNNPITGLILNGSDN